MLGQPVLWCRRDDKVADNRRWVLPASTYDIVVADVPWTYYGSPTKMGAAAKHYSLMTDDEVRAFPMRAFLNRAGILFLWATSPRMDFAVHCIEKWGLNYRGIAFEWIKVRKDGKPLGAQGLRPSVTKPVTEYVLAASTVKRGRPLPLCDEGARQVVFAPRMQHSRKPDEVLHRIDRMYPNATKIELFARRRFAGWDAWGNELHAGQGQVIGVA